MTKISSEYAAAIAALQLIYDLENPEPASPFKVEETTLAAITNYKSFSNLHYNYQKPNGHSKAIILWGW